MRTNYFGLVMTIKESFNIGEGIYTIPDCAKILKIPSHKLHRWVRGYYKASLDDIKEIYQPLADMFYWDEDGSYGLNFYTLVEIYIVDRLRELGLSLKVIRSARIELVEKFNSVYPFASHRLMSDSKRIFVELQEQSLMVLGTHGQTALQKIIEPFCKKLDFDMDTRLAERYWPLGKDKSVVIDPHHGFGRPTVTGSNLTTESVYYLYEAGENKETLKNLYDLTTNQVEDIITFERIEA
ncbi:MAG: DUF433 domain-containing protein [Thermodesulfobacteriota bacterium]